jgi:TolB-like protein/DNA-binding winged helix-turn-helix (wHTH) protein/Tfp pilus assembly protein PilF
VATEARPLNIVRFGDSLALDRCAFELRREGRQVRLERIPLDILLLLVERHGRLVTLREIASRLWGRHAGPEAEAHIASAVRKLRTALREDPREPRFIQTLEGRGYRFIAPLSPGYPEVIRQLPARTPAAVRPARLRAAPRRRPRLTWLIPAAALLTVAGALGLTLHLGAFSSAPAAEQPLRLAVLPLANASGSAREDALSDGLTRELLARLGSVEPARIAVVGGSAAAATGGNTSAGEQQAARAAHAKYVLEGSVRRDGDLVHVAAQLVRTEDQARIWSEQYDHELTSVPAMQAEMAAVITKGVHAAVTGHESASAAAKVVTHTSAVAPAESARAATPAHGRAADLTEQGRLLVAQRTTQGLQHAVQLYQQAISLDPQYAPAYAALAQAYTGASARGLGSPLQLMPQARAAAETALALDAELADAHVALGIVAADFDYRPQQAAGELRMAIAIDPRNAAAHAAYAALLARQGQPAAAIAESASALAVNALSPSLATDHAAVLYLSGEYAQATQVLNRTLALAPNEEGAQVLLVSEAQQGQLARALSQALAWHDALPSARASATAAYLYGRLGQSAQAQQALERMEAEARREATDPLPLRALALAGSGDREQLLRTLEAAYAEHAGFLTTLKVDPAFASLAGDARFQALQRSVGLN